MTGPLKNARHERFAQEVAIGKTAGPAYEAAGYNAKGHAAEAAGSRLLKNVEVKARVAEVQGKGAERASKTVADIVRQLETDRALAYKRGNASAAVSATMAQAKVLGLIVDKHLVGMKRIEDMNETELRALLGSGEERRA